MIIGVLREPAFETRVSLLPEATATLTKKGITVYVEQGAGERAFSNDDDYLKAGAQVKSRDEVLQSSDLLLAIHLPEKSQLDNLNSKVLIGVYQPLFAASASSREVCAYVTYISDEDGEAIVHTLICE